MAYRTSVNAVRAELEAQSTFTIDGDDVSVQVETLDDGQIKTVGLDPATLEVDERLTDTDMSSDRLKLIERYLAGHFLLTSNIDAVRQVDSESLDDGSSYDYAGDRDRDDYGSTSLGQKAIAMDQSGKLAGVNKPTASIGVPRTRE